MVPRKLLFSYSFSTFLPRPCCLALISRATAPDEKGGGDWLRFCSRPVKLDHEKTAGRKEKGLSHMTSEHYVMFFVEFRPPPSSTAFHSNNLYISYSQCGNFNPSPLPHCGHHIWKPFIREGDFPACDFFEKQREKWASVTQRWWRSQKIWSRSKIKIFPEI